MTVPINAAQVMGKNVKGVSFSLTNIPYGGRIYENGEPVFTNEPHLLIAIDVSDFDRTNIISDLGSIKLLKLTNDFIFIKNEHGAIADTKAILTLPTSQTMSNPIVKIVLQNDTGVMVSNIVFALNSSSEFRWLSNNVWCSSGLSPDSPSNNIIHGMFLKIGML